MRQRATCVLTTILGAALLCTGEARAGLDEYVKRPDPAYAWKVEDRAETQAGRVTSLALTSQAWKEIAWRHELQILEPKKIVHEGTMLLFITGGHVGGKAGPGDLETGFALANACGARAAVLHQVPNQPLLGGKSEDELIAETFVRYLETADEDWPLLFPMVKSAVRAMDAAQAWAKAEKLPDVTQFVVSGASKRGWTTWLTGAVDDRVIAIAPMVIVTLNMRAQNRNQIAVWGKYSEQIEDYTRRGLMEKVETERGTKLWKMIDPYSYLDRLKMPKLLINGANDRYWTHDALNIYWDDLKGPKGVVFLPNAGHGLGRAPRLRRERPGRLLPPRREASAHARPRMDARRRPRRLAPPDDQDQAACQGRDALGRPFRIERLPRIALGAEADDEGGRGLAGAGRTARAREDRPLRRRRVRGRWHAVPLVDADPVDEGGALNMGETRPVF